MFCGLGRQRQQADQHARCTQESVELLLAREAAHARHGLGRAAPAQHRKLEMRHGLRHPLAQHAQAHDADREVRALARLAVGPGALPRHRPRRRPVRGNAGSAHGRRTRPSAPPCRRRRCAPPRGSRGSFSFISASTPAPMLKMPLRRGCSSRNCCGGAQTTAWSACGAPGVHSSHGGLGQRRAQALQPGRGFRCRSGRTVMRMGRSCCV